MEKRITERVANAWKRALKWLKWAFSHPRAIALLISLFCLLVLFYPGYQLSELFHHSLLNQERAQLSGVLGSYTRSIEMALNQRLSFTHALKAYAEAEISRRPEIPAEEFIALAAGIYRSNEGMISIGVAPGGKLGLVYPQQAAENRPDGDLYAWLGSAGFTSNPVVKRIDAIRPGIPGLSFVQGVYKDGQLWGAVDIEQELQPLFTGAGLDSLTGQVDIAVRDDSGALLYGSERLFTMDAVHEYILLSGGSWELAAVPVNGWESAIAGPLMVVRLGGISLLLLGCMLIYLLTFRQARLQASVDRQTRSLSLELAERRRAEQALRESEEVYHRLIEASADAILLEDIDGRVLDCNSPALTMFGYSRAELQQLKAADLVADEIRPTLQNIAEAILKSEDISVETHNRRKDGSSFPVEVNLKQVIIGGEPRIIVYVRDITEKQRTADALRESEERLRMIIQNMPVMMAAFDDHSGILAWNRECERVTGFKADEMIGNPRALRMLFPEREYRQKVIEEWDDTDFDYRGLEQRMTCKDGSVRTVAWSNISHQFPVRNWNSWGIGIDITERKRVEEKIRLRNRELTLLNQVIAAAASSLDLKSVLHTILQELAQALDVPQAGAAVFDESGSHLRVVAEYMTENNPSALGALIPIDGNPATKYVLDQRQPLALSDARDDPMMLPVKQLMEQRGVESILLLPMVAHGNVLGTIGLDVFSRRTFTAEEISLAGNVTAAAAQAVENARLFAETQRRARELEAWASVSFALRAARTQKDMYPIVLDQVLELLPGMGAAIFIVEPASGELVCEQSHGLWAGIAGQRLFAGEGITGWVVNTGQVYWSDHPQEDSLLLRPGLMELIHTVVCVPLAAQGETIGALWLGLADPLNESDMRILSAIADTAASAIQRAAFFGETQLRLQRLTVLHNIDRAVSASLDHNIILNVLVQQLNLGLGVDAADVLLVNPNSENLRCVASYGFRSRRSDGYEVRAGEGLSGLAAQERRLVSIFNLADSAEARQDPRLEGEEFISYFSMPLIAKRELHGVLEIFFRELFWPDAEWGQFLETLAGQVSITIDNSMLFESLQVTNRDLAQAYDTTLEGWARALELRDRETEGHTRRVAELTIRLGRAIGMSEEELLRVRRGALLHDIGKLAIPDSILLKNGPLTSEEWEVMRKHPNYAYEMLSSIPYLRSSLDIPYYHHEHWDGSGYPLGLKGEQIPLAARIFSLVDVWDALCSDRPYRKAWPTAKVLEYFHEESGRFFDPHVVEVFFKLINEK